MDTKSIGDISNGQIIARMLRLKKIVLMPFGDNQRYDFVIEEDDGNFIRIQSKTGRLKDGAITFPTSSTHAHRGGKRKGYKGQADYFGVYCPDNDQCYLISVEICSERSFSLRLEPPKNNQTKGLNWASDYELK